jgi:hypothetical protein
MIRRLGKACQISAEGGGPIKGAFYQTFAIGGGFMTDLVRDARIRLRDDINGLEEKEMRETTLTGLW